MKFVVSLGKAPRTIKALGSDSNSKVVPQKAFRFIVSKYSLTRLNAPIFPMLGNLKFRMCVTRDAMPRSSHLDIEGDFEAA